MCSRGAIKKIVPVFLALLAAAVCIAGCSAADSSLTEKNNGDSIILKVNDTVEIKLESNPTTGYSWFLSDAVDDAVVSVSDPGFIESGKDEELVGAGGFEVFTVKALSPGKTEIILEYKRPWEEGVKPEDTFKTTVSVE